MMSLSKCSNPSMLILVPNIQNKNDLKERVNELVDSTHFDEETKSFDPDNNLNSNQWEYDCFPGKISTMGHLIDHLRLTDPELFHRKF